MAKTLVKLLFFASLGCSIYMVYIYFTKGHLAEISNLAPLVKQSPELLDNFNFVSLYWYIFILGHILCLIVPMPFYVMIKAYGDEDMETP